MKKKKRFIKSKKKKAKERLAKYKDSDGNHVETAIEKKVRKFLEQKGVYFIQEYPIKHKLKTRKKPLYKRYDFLVTDGNNYKFLIECDGDYWHARDYQEGIKPKSKLSKIQRKNLTNDKLKDRIAKELGIPLLRFFGTDIRLNFKSVKKEINKMIKSFPQESE